MVTLAGALHDHFGKLFFVFKRDVSILPERDTKTGDDYKSSLFDGNSYHGLYKI
jgi:hypothetical protein